MWYWRAAARDGNHTEAVSGYPSVDSFALSSVSAPAAPAINLHGNYDSGCSDTSVTVTWNPVASTDGGPVDYYVSTTEGDSGWLPSGQTGWSFTNCAGCGVTWQVQARDHNHQAAVSAWSSPEYFYDIGSACYSSSCPLIFTWNGSDFSYATDLQGPIIGLPPSNIQKDPRLYQPVYVVLDGLVPDEHGVYKVKIRESLPEITFVDEVKLLAVDYPEGYQIATSSVENTYDYNYANPFRIYTIKDPVLPVSATDKDGNDILALVVSVDNNPAPVVADSIDNFYTFDFGVIQHPENAKLLIDGWSIYGVKKFTAATTIQPYIEVVDGNGNWVKVKSIGTPAGDLKTMVIDISNIFLSSDLRIRVHLGIRRGSRWVIDRVRLDDSAPVGVTVQEIQASNGYLELGGKAIQSMATLQSRIIASDAGGPLDPSGFGYGSFTKYGEVGALLSAKDDMFVIMMYGDRMDMFFQAPGQPQPGMIRGIIIKADLFYKTLTTSNVVDPLPFHGMSAYPYSAPETYPTDDAHQHYILNYNTRTFVQ